MPSGTLFFIYKQLQVTRRLHFVLFLFFCYYYFFVDRLCLNELNLKKGNKNNNFLPLAIFLASINIYFDNERNQRICCRQMMLVQNIVCRNTYIIETHYRKMCFYRPCSKFQSKAEMCMRKKGVCAVVYMKWFFHS